MKRRRAFSLLELLVVVTILSLLAALLFPVFTQARRRALFASATVGLRQIGVATSQYMADNEGHLPVKNWGFLEPWEYDRDVRLGTLLDASNDPLAPYGARGMQRGGGIRETDNPMMCPGINRRYEYRWVFSIAETYDFREVTSEVRRIEPQPGSVTVRCDNLLTKGYSTGLFGTSTTYTDNPVEREGRELLLRGDGSVSSVDTRSERRFLRRPIDGQPTWTEVPSGQSGVGQAFSAWPNEAWPPEWTTILRPTEEKRP